MWTGGGPGAGVSRRVAGRHRRAERLLVPVTGLHDPGDPQAGATPKGFRCWWVGVPAPLGRTRPSCCTVLSADHPSSNVMCALRIWLRTFRSAWREMPVEAASEMMQIFFWPDWKASFSRIFTCRKDYFRKGKDRERTRAGLGESGQEKNQDAVQFRLLCLRTPLPKCCGGRRRTKSGPLSQTRFV